MNEGKKFDAPLAEVVDFNNDDIITLSAGNPSNLWKDDDNSEGWNI